jgi:hypothetical protein
MTHNGNPSNDMDDDTLVLGARAISEDIFDGALSPRQVYRLAETDPDFPIFRILGKLAGRRGAMRAELRRRELRSPGKVTSE